MAFLANQKGSGVKDLYFVRGDAHARMGGPLMRRMHFAKRSSCSRPIRKPTRTSSLLLGTEGRTADSTKLVFQLIDKFPVPPSYAAISTTLKAVGAEQGARYWPVQPEEISKRRSTAQADVLAGASP